MSDDDMERIPPNDITAEQAVLGAMMLSVSAIADASEALASSADFYRPAHQVIYETILDMYGRTLPVDPITLADELRERGELVRVDGAPYLHHCINQVPTAANAEYYAEIVRDVAILRRLDEVGGHIKQMVRAAKGDATGLVEQVQAEVAGVIDGTTRQATLIGDDMEDYLTRLEDFQRNGASVGVPTGFTDLDSLTGGFRPGEVIIVAARPAMGKSTLALDFLRAATITHGLPCALFSLEMGRDEIKNRLFSAQGQIALHHIRHQDGMNDDDWTRFAKVMARVSAAPLHIDDTPGQTLARIQARCRSMQQTTGLRMVVIDYLQLLHTGTSRKQENRQQEVAEMSRNIKLLAKDLQVPVVVLSQLNRGPMQRADKKPMASDLRESGSIEQDADFVILLHREDAYERESPRAGEADLIVEKNRNGPPATITTAFQGHFSRFVDMAQS